MEETRKQFKMGSLFDGSGAFPLASCVCGIEPVWASEVEPYPIKVTRARFPNMKHYGDISKINGAELETVDLVTGGSPCQSLSQAGKRDGMSKKCLSCGHKVLATEESDICPECGGVMAYTRSGLFMEQIRVIKEMRDADAVRKGLRSGRTDEHIRPRFMLWENVTGAFSSNKGEDFRAVLEETARIVEKTAIIPRPPKGKWNNAGLIMGDGYSIAWRVLDAQFWGVPQRRRRIALVADFGGQCAGEILFKRDGLSRNFTESRHSWQSLTGCASESIGETGECDVNTYFFENHSQDTRYKGPLDISPTVSATYGMGGNNQPFVVHEKCFAIENHPNDSRIKIDNNGICQSLTSRMGTGGGNVPLTMESKKHTYRKTSHPRNADEGQGWEETKVNDTLNTFDTGEARTPTLVCEPINIQENPKQLYVDTSHANDVVRIDEKVSALQARGYKGGNNVAIPVTMQVRCGKEGGGKGALLQKDLSATLSTSNVQTLFQPKKAYGICSYASNSMKSDNPNSGIYEADTARTLDLNGGNPACNQGGIAICEPKSVCVIEGNGSRPSHRGDGYKESDIMYTLNATEQHGVCYSLDRASFNQGKNAKYDISIQEDVSQTLVARGPNAVMHEDKKSYRMEAFGQYSESDKASCMKSRDHKDATDLIVDTEYIVRRLTPLECSRLQGMPDWWVDNIAIENPTEEDLQFWREVFETHREIVTNAKKPKTDKQIINWLKKPDTDGAKYKMWGNGIALPCFLYVIEGIKEVLERTSTENHETQTTTNVTQ